MGWLQWLGWASAVVAFGAALVGLIKGIPAAWRVVFRWLSTMNALSNLPNELEAQKRFRVDVARSLARQDKTLAGQNGQIAVIKNQLFPNGGSTMRDDVQVIRSKLANDDGRIRALEEWKREQGK